MSSQNERHMIFLRHAHAGVSDPNDRHLSEKGQKQMREFTPILANTMKGQSPQLLSSPKARCQETLRGLSETLKTPIEIETLLEERKHTETRSDSESRLSEFLAQWIENGEKNCILCSHGDCIPIMIYQCVGISTEIKRAGWADLIYTEDSWKLLDIIQPDDWGRF